MYRQERRSELSSRAVFLILPYNYYKKDEILHDLHLQMVDVIEKRSTRMERADMKAWLAEESNIFCPEIQEGPSMVILTQGIEVFDKMAKVAKYHNESSRVNPISLIESCDLLREADEYLSTAVMPTLNVLLSQMSAERPEDPILWLADRLRDLSPMQKIKETKEAGI